MSEPTAKKVKSTRRVGIVGFGKVGNFLAKSVVDEGAAKGVELAWVRPTIPQITPSHHKTVKKIITISSYRTRELHAALDYILY